MPRLPGKKLCVAFRENRVIELPNRGERKRQTLRRFAAFVAWRNGRFLVRQRPAGVVNAHLWEFPNVELANGTDAAAAARNVLGFRIRSLTPLGTLRHSITRYRITVEAYAVKAPQRARTLESGGKWLREDELARLPFPSAHGRLLQIALDAHRRPRRQRSPLSSATRRQ